MNDSNAKSHSDLSSPIRGQGAAFNIFSTTDPFIFQILFRMQKQFYGADENNNFP